MNTEKQQRGLRLKTFRLKILEMTQVELAELIGTSQANYNLIERGVNELIPDTLFLLGSKFGYSPTFHLFGVGEILDSRILSSNS